MCEFQSIPLEGSNFELPAFMVVHATGEEAHIRVLLPGKEGYAIDVENPPDLTPIKGKYDNLGGIFSRRSKRLRNLSPTEVEERSSYVPLRLVRKVNPRVIALRRQGK